jgi:hypothetical protein
VGCKRVGGTTVVWNGSILVREFTVQDSDKIVLVEAAATSRSSRKPSANTFKLGLDHNSTQRFGRFFCKMCTKLLTISR